MGIAHTDSQEQ